MTVDPWPAARSSAVATKETADFLQPVRWTTRARSRSATSASTARLVLAQPCLVGGVADEAGEDSVGLEAQLGVGHGSMQPVPDAFRE